MHRVPRRGLEWAQRHGQKILIDLHTVPGSQNGFDNGGICGVCTFHQKAENVEFALTVLERLAGRYRDHPSLWGIQVLNEPISQELWDLIDIPTRYPAVDPAEAAGSEPVPTEFLRRFHRDAYERIRAHAPEVTVVFHGGFRIEEWKGYFTAPDFENVVLDTHLYLMMLTMSAGDRELDEYLAFVADRFAGAVREAARDVPVMIGEWCLDTASKKPLELTDDERRSYFRKIADAQLRAWEPAVAWTYWSYKLHTKDPQHDPWDMGRAIELRWLPEELAPPPGDRSDVHENDVRAIEGWPCVSTPRGERGLVPTVPVSLVRHGATTRLGPTNRTGIVHRAMPSLRSTS